MQAAALSTVQYPQRRWRDNPQGQTRVRRSVRLVDAVSGEVIVQRVLDAAQLDPATRQRMTCILMVTLRDWARGETPAR